MTGLELAGFDPATGKARIHRIEGGEVLKAARCALGCMGAILSVRVPLVPSAPVHETVQRCSSLEAVLSEEPEYPFQHFLLVPYRWNWIAYRRKRVPSRGARSLRLSAGLASLPLALLLKALIALNDSRATRGFYRHFFTALAPRGSRTLGAEAQATGPWRAPFAHLEMELLLPARHLRPAAALLRHVLSEFADDGSCDPEATALLRRIGMADALESERGRYAHHFPILFRRVLPDDALITPTSLAREAYYAASFLSYRRERDGFLALADFLARSLVRLYGAKCHWGTYNPLVYAEIAPLYPGLAAFRAQCAAHDRRGVFRNDYAARMLGFATLGREE